ncbi:MAG: ABC transporter substrate-binding protein [Dehalococcoidia bacterium]|nr:ABC transporter substrate-binding protein [Dehalococcoidia bacterium]
MLSAKNVLRSVLCMSVVAIMLMLMACGGTSDESSTTCTNDRAATPDSTGVTDTEIKLGTHFPLSQNPAAAYAPIAYGIKAFFDYINAQGGIYGRKINFIIGDDHYSPADTVEVVRQLVEGDKVFAVVGGLGEETHSAVWKYLEEKGVPDMFVTTGLDKWTNPVARTRFAGNPDYMTEGSILGQYIVKNYPNAKVGLLRQSDEMGQEGETGLRNGIQGSDVEITAVENYDVIQSDVTAQTQRLKNANVDVLIAYAIPPQAASMVKAVRGTLNWDVPILVSGINCSDIFILLAGAEHAEGIVSVVFGPQVYQTDHPAVQKYQKIWEKFGTGEAFSNFAMYGMSDGEMMVHLLERAGPDLTRGSFLDAAESECGFWCSGCVGIGPQSMSSTDHRAIEDEMYTQVQDGKWVAIGEPVGFESTPNCTPMTPPEGFDQQPKVGMDAPYVETP